MSALLQQNFSRYAAQYEARAHFQRVQCARVADAALMLLPERARVLDVGCGTGMFHALTKEKRPGWQWLGLDIAAGMCAQAKLHGSVMQADAALLPLADGSVDAVVSSLCLQWAPLNSALAEMHRVLRPGGRLIVSSLGDATLHELRAAAHHAGLPLALLPMQSAAAYKNALTRAGFALTCFDARHTVLPYANVRALLDSMRRIGAGNHLPRVGGSLTGAKRWQAMLTHYEQWRKPEGLPATWDVFFMLGRKP